MLNRLQRIEEELKSWGDVIKEENEAMKFRVAGRHHAYLGVEYVFHFCCDLNNLIEFDIELHNRRLFPLKIYPTTIEVRPLSLHLLFSL